MKNEFDPKNIVYGDAGVLLIPSLDIQRPLYSQLSKNVNGQVLVDAENSAYYCQRKNIDYIADHAGQGFDKIKKAQIYTIAFIQTPKETQCYYCTLITLGTRKKDKHFYLPNDEKFLNVTWADLCCYCCNDATGNNVTMTFFKKGFKTDYPLYK